MASEKVTEVEMEAISKAEEKRESEGAEKVHETKGEKEVEEKEKEYGEKEEEDDPLYSKLNTPTEDVYSLAALTTPLTKQQEDVYKKVTLYRRLSAILLLICVVLLAVLLALAVKLSEAKASQQCPLTEESSEAPAVCSPQICNRMFPTEGVSVSSGPAAHVCSECGRGWLKFEDSCYMLSQERRSWQESREECLKLGGDLVVISNDRVQRFLTNKGLMQYWIGLQRSEAQDWTWINNTTLTTSYWTRNLQDGNCAFLNGGKWHKINWHPSPCSLNSNYICQRG